MTQATSKRRGHGEDSIYWDASKGRYTGAVSLGFSPAGTRIRKKVSGRTKAEVRDKLRELHQQVDSGLRPRRRYTVGDALEDWLAHGVDGLSERTVTLYRGTIVKALNEELGAVRLTELTAGDVQGALAAMAPRLSTRTLQIAHNVLVRAIRQAERDDLVARNVAALVKPPKGQLGGRPSKSLTLEQAIALMASGSRQARPGSITSSWRCSCGAPIVPAVIRRRRTPGGRWRCRGGAWRRCGSIGRSRRRTGSRRGRYGKTTTWCSLQPSEHRWMITTCGGSSA